jgi:holo-ACP synthase/triphosphoribosyl-dephospho-CoA synthase
LNKELELILEAKDKRADYRKTISDSRCVSVSLTLNIPGYPKSTELINSFFVNVLESLKDYLLANRVFIDSQNEIIITDNAGDFYIVPIVRSEISNSQLKEICENFEGNHKLGRLIDVDITDNVNTPVSSHKQKLCYCCGEHPAIVCMRNKNHNYRDIRVKIKQDMSKYMENVKREDVCSDLSSIALKSILYEVSLTPKPGLVDRNNNGSHKDMDFLSFVNSSSALSPYFLKLAKIGYGYTDRDFTKVLPLIREIGLEMERVMFKSTNSVNTQKGIIFLLGLSIFSASNTIATKGLFDINDFSNTIKYICKDLVVNELYKNNLNVTHGEKIFNESGISGVRGEAEKGLPTVLDYGLPELEKNLEGIDYADDKIMNRALTKTLLRIMSVNDDTNIIFRQNIDVLNELKSISLKALNSDKELFSSEYQKVIEYCKDKYISPGGSADLLAVTIFT